MDKTVLNRTNKILIKSTFANMKEGHHSSFSSPRISACLRKSLAGKSCILLLFILLLSCLWLSAQITVTNATFPVAGDTLRKVTATNPAIGIAVYTPPGGPQTSNLSGFNAGSTKNFVFQPG
jgi:hypothetical protein